MVNYFDFFGIPMSFFPDEAHLRKQFLLNSKRFHPDFFTMENAADQEEALEKSTINNEAFRVLSDQDSRMEYILRIHGHLQTEGADKMSPDFLMEMMDINEAIMELEFDPQSAAFAEIKAQVDRLQTDWEKEILPVLQSFENQEDTITSLEEVKIFFLKKRYLLRILEKLSNFASP